MQAASSGTKYAKEQEKTSDGRAVWLALTANHSGKER